MDKINTARINTGGKGGSWQERGEAFPPHFAHFLFFFLFSSNNKIVNFLDVTLNLSNNTYKPFLKMDQYPSYINVHLESPEDHN